MLATKNTVLVIHCPCFGKFMLYFVVFSCLSSCFVVFRRLLGVYTDRFPFVSMQRSGRLAAGAGRGGCPSSVHCCRLRVDAI